MPKKAKTKATGLPAAEAFFLKRGQEKGGTLDEAFLLDIVDGFELSEDEYEALIAYLSDRGIKIIEPDIFAKPQKISTEGISDPVRLYMAQMGRFPLLTKDQEVELAKRIVNTEKAKNDLTAATAQGNAGAITAAQAEVADVLEAKNALIDSNLRLVVNIAKHYAGGGVPLQDLIQEGNIGLTRAAEKFDYTRGFKFSTYATWWIRQAITRAIADQSRNIRIPVHVVENLQKIKRIKTELAQKFGRDPTAEEVAHEIPGMSEENIRYYDNLPLSTMSLDTPIGDEDGDEYINFVSDPSESTEMTDDIDVADEMSLIGKSMSILSPRERDILTKCYGLQDGIPKSLEEVGQKYGLSRERIRQIRDAALAKMRKEIRK
jgi:RNA polymerase sigma factor (sigma-70 family)